MKCFISLGKLCMDLFDRMKEARTELRMAIVLLRTVTTELESMRSQPNAERVAEESAE